MAEPQTEDRDSEFTTEDFARIAEKSQRVMQAFMERHSNDQSAANDAMRMSQTFMEAAAHLWANPARLMEVQANLWKGYMDLWQATAMRFAGQEVEPVVAPEKGDRRFRHEAWQDNALFDYLKQSYLLTAGWLRDSLSDIDGLDQKTQRKLDFYTSLYVDALSPTNFAMTNPEVLEETIETKGQNLVKGLENLLEDFERGDGKLAIRMVDVEDFEVGENLATTPGKVVFENELMQLIQYSPANEEVRRKPLLIVPPWINKYYILDLRPENSFIRWVVEQGYTVFVVSWVNPDSELAQKTFDDYLMDGPIAALDAIEQATGESSINALGYCIGGTLLACTMAWLAAKGDKRIASASYLTTLVDFEQVGDVEVFIDENQVESLEKLMNERGYLEGSEMAATFNTLRANDLVWSFVINNYMMGKDPFAFDILYWNSDSTRMPAVMHSQYLRKLYLDNALSSGTFELAGERLDLGGIKAPSYVLSTREDHIAPWESTYKAVHHYGGPTTFVLAMSGHVAGVINPPAKNKYGFWTKSQKPARPETWLDGAEQHDGSWWPHWEAWLSRRSGAKIPARAPGDGDLEPIEDAPGRYVKVDLREGN